MTEWAVANLSKRQLAVLTALYEPNDNPGPGARRTLESLRRRGLAYCSTHGRWRCSTTGAALVRSSRR